MGIRLPTWEREGMGIDSMGMGGNGNVKSILHSLYSRHMRLLTAEFAKSSCRTGISLLDAAKPRTLLCGCAGGVQRCTWGVSLTRCGPVCHGGRTVAVPRTGCADGCSTAFGALPSGVCATITTTAMSTLATPARYSRSPLCPPPRPPMPPTTEPRNRRSAHKTRGGTNNNVAVDPGSTILNASASGRDADFPGSRGSGVSGT